MGDGSLQEVASAIGGDEPDHQGEDVAIAVAGLGAGGLVFLVAPAGGDDAAGVLGSPINLDEVAVLIGWASDGHGQVGAQHLHLAAGAERSAPAVRLQGHRRLGVLLLADGLLDAGAHLRYCEEVVQEGGRHLTGPLPPSRRSPDGHGRAALPAPDPPLQARQEALLGQAGQVALGLAQGRGRQGVLQGGEPGELRGGGKAVGRHQGEQARLHRMDRRRHQR